MTSQTINWLNWNGNTSGLVGGLPVEKAAQVSVIFRNGHGRVSRADDFNWSYSLASNDEADIVKYRVLQSTPATGEDWIKWKGGTRPVAPSSAVDVMYRKGIAACGVLASSFDWAHLGIDSDVVAYRECSKPVAAKPQYASEPTTLDAQFNDFMEGLAASEDHDDMRRALGSLGLDENTVAKMMTALAHSEAKATRIEATAAMSTLFRLGYTYTHGAELWKPPIGTAPAFSAPDLLDAAAGHMKQRAATYDKPEGERSIGATVDAFNAITGRDLRESEGWLLMTLLKLVRSESKDAPHRDSIEDLIAYSGLYGEARLRGL